MQHDKTGARVLALLALWLLAGVGQAAQPVLVHVPGAQIIEVRLADNQLVIDGLLYKVPLDARIEVRGSYGAFTMLEPGMKAEFIYRDSGAELREVLALRQLADGAEIPRH